MMNPQWLLLPLPLASGVDGAAAVHGTFAQLLATTAWQWCATESLEKWNNTTFKLKNGIWLVEMMNFAFPLTMPGTGKFNDHYIYMTSNFYVLNGSGSMMRISWLRTFLPLTSFPVHHLTTWTSTITVGVQKFGAPYVKKNGSCVTLNLFAWIWSWRY